MCGDNHKVRMHGNTDSFHLLMGIPLLSDDSGLQDSRRIRLSHHNCSELINQTVCNFVWLKSSKIMEQKKVFSDTFKLLRQTFHMHGITV